MDNKHEENSDKVLPLHLAQVQSQPLFTDSKVKETSQRRVSFNLNHRYLEAKNPWDTRKSHPALKSSELKELYRKSCQYHAASPNDKVIESLESLNLVPSSSTNRTEVLNLRDQTLTHGSCEALEELFKWIQYRSIDVSSCGLDDVSGSALFDMIEYYEATNELNISENSNIKTRGWQSCINMIKKSRELHTFATRSTPLSDNNASQLGTALLTSYIYTLKLEQCGLSGRPILSLCGHLKKNTILRELCLANNELNCNDAYHISTILKSNLHLQLLDISNNDIQDEGCRYITEALIYQSKNLTTKSPTGSTLSFDFSDLTGALNTINNNRNRFSPTPKIDVKVQRSVKKLDDDLKISSIDSENTNKNRNINNSNNNNNNNNNSILLTCDTNDELLKKSREDGQDGERAVGESQESVAKEKEKKVVAEQVVVVEKPIDEESPKSDKLEPLVNPKSFARSISDLEPSDESAKDQGNASTKTYTTASLSPISHDDNSTMHGFLTDQRSPERSFSSESLCSETSIESNDSKSSIKLIEQKFNKYGTLERQSVTTQSTIESEKLPTGLQVLILWNNNLTKKCAECFAELISVTNILEILNVGQNVLTDQFLTDIKLSIKSNKSVNSLGLQNTGLTSEGAKTIAEIIQFGGNAILQRIDLRSNEILMFGLTALNEAMKCNKSIIRLDLDDTPIGSTIPVFDNVTEYTRVVNTIRAQCSRNENPPEPVPIRAQPSLPMDRMKINHYSRKISLTCQSVKVKPVPIKPEKHEKNLLDPINKKTSSRLKSPLPSPTPSPISSPLPSPSRSRFQVSRVTEANNKLAANSTNSSPSPSSSSGSPTFFPAKPTNSRFHVTRVETPKIKKDPIKTSTPLPSPHPPSYAHPPHPNTTIPAKVSVPVQVDINIKETVSVPVVSAPAPVQIVPAPNTTQSSSFLNVSNTSILSQSLDSPDPDYEVKKYMDLDSCSSFSSSMDSIDHPIDLNVSTDSLNVVERPVVQLEPKIEIEVSNENTIISNSSSSSNEGHTLTPTDISPKDTLKRVRKTSWIHSIGGKHVSAGETHNYPATLDKLINLFHNPGILFQKTSPDSTLSTSPSSTSSISGASKPKAINAAKQDTGNTARESPISGLLHWAAATLSHKKEDKEATLRSCASVPNQTSILQNISPENSINKATNTQMIIESLPKPVKKELKENISPEHTISSEKIGNLETTSKVLFQVGDYDDNQTAPAAITEEEDEDESEDDKIEVLVKVEGSQQKTLGQMARDSLSILKHHESSVDSNSLAVD